jgi:nitroimidazol reductase NimA-like FMN-containing flavoprotein (pyridoxamine 5'-phosphate oxidase superfamily)
MREDGWPHVTPIWYVWENGRFVLSLGKSRRHLTNIARDPKVTLCVDEDPRTTDLTKSPQAVVCFGLATLYDDDPTVRDVTTKVEERYLPAEARGPELDELLWFEGRVAVVIEPERWLAWDQGKG